MTEAELEKRRAERAAKTKQALKDRDLADLEALDALEERLGSDNLRKVKIPTPANLPGIVIIRRPDRREYKSWQSVVGKTSVPQVERQQTTKNLGRECVLYPEDAAVWDKIIEVCPGAEDLVAQEAIIFAGGAQDSGKE